MRKRIREEDIDVIMEAWQYCDDNDKSDGLFMLEYISDTTGIEFNSIVTYLSSSKSHADRKKWILKKNQL